MAASTPERFNVLGAGISALKFLQARDLVLTARYGGPLGYICVCTVHGVSEAVEDASFRSILNRSFLTTPDGMPLVWLGPTGVERVYGPDLMLAVCDVGRSHGLRHYFIGGAPGVAQTLTENLTTKYPGLQVTGTYTPPYRPLSENETATLTADVQRARPDVIWVGLSTPKQERFMAEHWQSLRAGVLIGVGAAFDFHSGRVRQAPRWVQRSGFEWLFRLCMEPRRLAGRYFKTNPLFVCRILGQRLGLRSYPLEVNTGP